MSSTFLNPTTPGFRFYHESQSPFVPYAGQQRRSSLRVRSDSAATGRKSRRQDDDYHSTLKALNSRGRFPRKSLGQHYMLNESINEELVAAANVKEGDVVLEIGPGTGSLTSVLVNSGATVLAIEKDPHMAELVKERFAGIHHVQVLQQDFTRSHIRSHMSSMLQQPRSHGDGTSLAKVVANIPFNISTDVVKQLLPMGDIFSHVVLLLQDEAALRLVDSSLNSSEYRPINIFVNFYSDPEYKTKVSRTNFFPQPKVDAAIVVFRLKQIADYPEVPSIKSFFSMVNSAFNGKRKMLRRSLQHICSSSDIEAALLTAGLAATVSFSSFDLVCDLKYQNLRWSLQSRPEELTLQDFLKLHNLLEKQSARQGHIMDHNFGV